VKTGAITSVLIAGKGLAFEMCLAGLAKGLPQTITITALELSEQDNRDCLYGGITSPNAHNFLLNLGLDEAELVSKTNSVFSYGTHFQDWGGRHNWVQCFNNPFPVWENVPFHQFMSRAGTTLEPFLAGAQTGLAGRFAHPPQDPTIPLSTAEYGYMFEPDELCQRLKHKTYPNVSRIDGAISSVIEKNGAISTIELKSGEKLDVDFFVDASGHEAILLSQLGIKFDVDRTLAASHFSHTVDEPGQSLRFVRGNSNGWTAKSIHRGASETLQITAKGNADTSFEFSTGSRNAGWAGNCAGIGHSVYCLEPLTPAPMMLLQLDIERLLDLFPLKTKMSVEAKEYNRLLSNDVLHCQMFTKSLFEIENPPDTPYWQSARSKPLHDGLKRKLDQFDSRGLIATYDLEPFNQEDWLIQHFGLGRRPKRYDPMLDQISKEAIKGRLEQIRTNINSMVQKVPPSDRYIENFRRYLEKKHGQ